MIKTTYLKTDQNPCFETDQGNETNDKVFLLSINEISEYLRTNEKRLCKATPYAKKQGVYVDQMGNVSWWVRTIGNNKNTACFVFSSGAIICSGVRNDINNNAVRPAMWIKA